MFSITKKSYWPIVATLLIVLFAIWAPNTSFADDSSTPILTSDSSSHYFDPAPQDVSMLFLSNIFGSVGTVLPGSGSTLMSELFGALNPMILALGIVFAAYAAFMGIINTSAEGEMLGKKMSSIWTPIRITFGIAGLIPITTSGYCVIQVFVMWMATQGIGAADNIWHTAVEYVKSGKIIHAKSSYDSFANADYETAVSTIFQGLVCQQSLYKNYPEANPGSAPAAPDAVLGDNYTISYTFDKAKGGTDGKTVNCGSFSFSADAIDTGPLDEPMQTAIKTAMNSIMPSLNATAYYYVNYPDQDDRDQGTYDFVGSSYITNIEGVYHSAILNGAHESEGNENNSSAWDWAENYGWLTAGGLYYKIAKDNNSLSEDTMERALLMQWGQKLNKEHAGSEVSHDYDDAADFISALQLSYTNSAGSGGYNPSASTMAIGEAETLGVSAVGGAALAGLVSVGSASASGAIAFVAAALIVKVSMIAIIDSFESSLMDDGHDPIVNAQKLGHKMLLAVEIIWMLLLAALTGMALYEGIMASIEPLWLTVVVGLSMVLPIVFLLLGALTLLGMTLAVLVPFLPLTIFSIAAIGWLVVVIEAMVAAPLIMIGIMYPDGHEVWGKAEPAILIVINMFLRPSLMIIGMLAGMLVSYAGLSIVNMGFAATVTTLMGSSRAFNAASTATIIETIGYLTVYTGLFLMVLNESFSLIIVVPDKVFRYLQGGEATGAGRGLQEGMQKVQGQFDQNSQQAKELGNTAGQSVKGGAETARSFGYERRNSEDLKQKAKADAKVNDGSSGRMSEGKGGGPDALAEQAKRKAEVDKAQEQQRQNSRNVGGAGGPPAGGGGKPPG